MFYLLFIMFYITTQLDESIDLKLLGGTIPKCDQAIFLGIRFDPKLSFKYQAKYLEEACIKRFSILKILSHKKFKIKKNTFIKNLSTTDSFSNRLLFYNFIEDSEISMIN